MGGILITFEGGEGAGKTTLIESIAQVLHNEGISFVKVREPGGTSLGEDLRKLLLMHPEPLSPYAELTLFLASRAQHILEVIGPALQSGKVVLCDRFHDSTIAYQGAARGLGAKAVEQMCAFISQGLAPHLTLYLDIDPKVGLARTASRSSSDRIEQEKLEFHQKIREAFRQIHREHPSRFHLLNAELPPEHVFEEAMKSIRPLLLHHV